MYYANNGTKVDDKIVELVNGDIYFGKDKLHSGTKSIVNYVFIWSIYVTSVLLYFQCVCKVLRKYLVSF